MTVNPPSARDRGLQLLREGSLADSIEFLLQTIVEDPADVDAYLYLALAYARQGNFDKCVSLLEQAVDLAPDSAKVHYNLGVAYHKAQNLAQAKDSYLRAIGLDPNYAAAKNAFEMLTRSSGTGEIESSPADS